VQPLDQPNEDVGNLLNDWRRVNVAFTRAKAKLIIIGSSAALQRNHLFSSLLGTLKEQEWIHRLPKNALATR
jgi:DNA replication ATP-dependent helicase Dna2